MKVEHLTLSGNTLVRDSKDIEFFTLSYLKDFQITDTTKTIDFPKSDLKVKITSSGEGAVFDVMKGENILFTNICCFREEYSSEMFDLVKRFARMIPIYKTTIVRNPDLNQFLYTVPIAPFMASINEIMMTGEIELYIYYSLYLAQRETK